MAWKISRTQQAGALGLVLLLLIPPVSSSVSTGLVLEPGASAHIRAEVPGQIQAVYVKSGDTVRTGQLLAVLQNPVLKAEAESLRQELALANSQLRTAQDRSDFDSTASALRDRTRLQQELAVAQQRAASLEIRAPIDGVVATSNLDQLPGSFLAAGDEFAQIVNRSTMKARILVRDWDLQDVQQGALVRAKVVPFPYRTYSGRVGRIYPASALDRPVTETENLERLGQKLTNYFAVDMEFSNPDGSLREGMTGTAKVSGKRASLAWQASRAMWRWAHSQAW